jgi:cell wall-associated NlpC family hydrolase
MQEDEAMERDPSRVVERARLAVGARFRPQGRRIEDGLDCVGLAAFAFAAEQAAVPGDYFLRGGTLEAMARQLGALGFAPAPGAEFRPGDLGVFAPGPGQLHLGIVTGTSLIHADAGLRRVVERPMPPPWPLAGLWRVRSEREEG